MKNVSGSIIVLTILTATACINTRHPKTKADITADTLAYTYQTIKERAPDCGTKPDKDCTLAKITFQLFNAQPALNDFVSQKLLYLPLPGTHPDKDLQTQAKNFITGYGQFKKHARDIKFPFKLNTHAIVLRQDSSLVTIDVGGYSYAGGAHGTSLTFFINWNTKAQKIITLNDLLVGDYKPLLTQIAEQIFRKNENLKDTSSLARDYFFKDNQFVLNNNFVITPIGLRFLYNQYEIKPYAAGTSDLYIPYQLIIPLLKRNTVITQYIK